ncbi:protein FAM193A-like [Arapaima gigas]
MLTPVSCAQFTEGLLNSQFAGALRTPFTFGLGQKAPYPAEERCLLCQGERKDSSLPDSWIPGSNTGGFFVPPKTNSLLQLPLWVCPGCRSAVEREEQHSIVEQSLVRPSCGCLQSRVVNGTVREGF